MSQTSKKPVQKADGEQPKKKRTYKDPQAASENSRRAVAKVHSIYGPLAERTEHDEVSECITNSCLLLMQLPRIDTYDAEQVMQRITEYFQIVTQYSLKPTFESLALALKLTRSTLVDIITGRVSRPADVREIIIHTHTAIQAMMAGYMTDSKVNPIAGIFLMKNNMGYSNEETGLNFAEPEHRDGKSLEDKYNHLLDE